MARFGLIPREERFFELFAKNADNALAAARALNELFYDYTDVERKVRRLKDIEHTADEVTHEIFHALDRSFVAPFDREDIARLAGALDDVDWIRSRQALACIRSPMPGAARRARAARASRSSLARVPLLAQ
jgi:hypothetical protein